jgi:hypothetical protein
MNVQTIAFYATLDKTIPGLALRAADGTVHFQAASTGLWTQLYDVDAPRLQLHGRKDLADSQALLDGDVVHKASRTLQRAA